MKINKFTKLAYIFNGKLTVIEIIYNHEILDNVPLYYSKDVSGVNVIKIDENRLIAVINSDYAKQLDKNTLQMLVWRLVIKTNHSNLSDEALDLLCAKSFGINNTINIVKLTGHNKENREALLLNNVASIKNAKLKEFDNIPLIV